MPRLKTDQRADHATRPADDAEPLGNVAQGVLLIYLALGLALFAPVVGAFFVSDDFVYLSALAHPRWPDVLIWQPGVFRPLHALLGLLEFQVWGLNPVGYHLTNIVSHCVTAFLVFVVTRRLVRSVASEIDAMWAALVAGLVFLVQPSHTEAVSWIIGRHDILATLFVLVSWQIAIGSQATAALLASSLAFLIALLFKESVITFPVILVVYEAFCRKHIHWKLPVTFVVAVGVYLLVRRVAAGDLVAGYEAAFIRPSWSMLPNLASTLFRSFLPYVPVELLPQLPKMGLTSLAVLVAAIATVAVSLVLLRRVWAGRKLMLFLFAALVLSTLPTLAFAPSLIASESERYTYLPSVFAAMIVGLTLTTLTRTRLARVGAMAAVAVLLGAFLELSNQNWRRAGELSRQILTTLQAEPAEAALLVPDSLNGAFIYRNGLNEALSLFGPRPAQPIPVITQIFLRWPDEVVTLERMDDGRYSIRVPSARSTLRLVPGVNESALSASNVDLYRVDVKPHRPVRVAYYSGGKLEFSQLAADRE